MAGTKQRRDTALRLKRVTVDPAVLRAVLRERRAALDLSIADLAGLAKVAPATIHRLEGGNYRVQLDKLLLILNALDLVPTQIMAIDDKRDAPPSTDLERELAKAVRRGNSADLLETIAKILRNHEA